MIDNNSKYLCGSIKLIKKLENRKHLALTTSLSILFIQKHLLFGVYLRLMKFVEFDLTYVLTIRFNNTNYKGDFDSGKTATLVSICMNS